MIEYVHMPNPNTELYVLLLMNHVKSCQFIIMRTCLSKNLIGFIDGLKKESLVGQVK